MSGDRHSDKPLGKQGAVGHVLGIASELGITMGLVSAAMLLGCLALGRWLDRLLSSAPVLTIALLVVGALASQVSLYYMAVRASAQINRGARPILSRAGLARTVGLVARVFLFAVLPALVGAVLGILLDQLLRTSILLTAVLTLLGFATGVICLLRWVRGRPDLSQGDA